ncbi:uncharacterized protein LOC133833127 [Humulus lupulus]|uniref:uncharacterized protein LOC133833127 n=1 Tax=Humulus lupulus TaxID=3486 RepID=UPI002B4159A0|nr:uncharacterized protein LOC133833127 [Humulus lupulus]
MNKQSQSLNVIKLHLLTHGFLSTYTTWTHHGEEIEGVEDEVLADVEDAEATDDLSAGLQDAFGGPYFDIGPTSDFIDNEFPRNSNDKYDALLDSVHNPLYENCTKFSVLSVVVKLMNLKVINKWTDKGFDDLLKCLKEMLPDGNHCPISYYQTRRLLSEVGLGYEQIDVCQYDCALFYGENANATMCPICKSSRYVRNKIPHIQLRWFPIKARLKRLFSSKHTAKVMRWHKEVRKDEPGILRHPADGDAWKHFDKTYPEFAVDSRSVRMGLASDGFNPFSNMTSMYSLWPVILIPYNMPPWASPNGTNYLMSLLIPGPKSPGKDYDVFLRPLIEELKELWEGIEAYDSYEGCMFKLRAAILWTISDFPAYAYLSGWSTAGKLACPVCLEDTRSKRITDKQCFMGHQCYLRNNHSWRKSREYDGATEFRPPPRTFTGAEILKQLEQVPTRTTGKAPSNSSSKRKRGENELNWCKKSILFELSYWSQLLLRHNLDVMHIKKNVCDNIIGTLLDIEGKSKDTLKARKDLENLNIRSDLWLKKSSNNKIEKPHASYTLTKEECKEFCKFIRSVRLPDGYASNISRCVIDNDKLGGMKSHDCHILLQKILPVALLPFLTKEIQTALIELCQFFQKICAKTIQVDDITKLKDGIVIILCKLEKIFPPSFFTVMVHLCVHLPDQVLLGGPVASRWMFGTERHMGLYKKYVRNMSRPDGSIAEAFVIDELEHKTLLEERGLSGEQILTAQMKEFPSWFKTKISELRVQQSSLANDDLYSLSQGPLERYMSYHSCIVNGVRFRCKDRDDNLRTQCSGVCTEGDHDNDTIMYYGVLLEILQLSFLFDRKVFLFRCKWYNSNPKGNSIYVDHNLTFINTSTNWFLDEPFILATQAQQVFYLREMKRGSNWRIVQKVNHRSIYDIPEKSHVEDDSLNNDIFQEDHSFMLPPFQPTEDLIDSSSLVRTDVAPLSLSSEFVQMNIGRDVDEDEYIEVNEDFDDGDIFFDEDVICSSDSEAETDFEEEFDDDIES